MNPPANQHQEWGRGGCPLWSMQEEILHHEGGETLAQVAQRSCGCPLPGRAQDQVGWSSEQPGLVEDVPTHGRGVGTR